MSVLINSEFNFAISVRCVKLHLRHKRTERRVSLSLLFVRGVCQWRPSYGWTKRDVSQNL